MPASTDIDKEIARLARLGAADRLQQAGSALEQHRVAMHRLAAMRAQAVQELRAEGRTLEDIAKLIGVTRQQIHRIAHSGDTAR